MLKYTFYLEVYSYQKIMKEVFYNYELIIKKHRSIFFFFAYQRIGIKNQFL